jgi:hypothetical protein
MASLSLLSFSAGSFATNLRPVPSDDATYFVADGNYDLEAFLDRPAAHADTELRLSASAAITISPAVAVIAAVAVIRAAPAIATASVVAAATCVAAIAATSAVGLVAIVVAAIISWVTRGAIATITAVSINGAR